MANSTSNIPEESNSFAGIDFQEIYHLLREKAWLIALSVLIGCAFAGAYIIRSPRIYAARTLVQVEQAHRKVVNIEDIRRDDLGSMELLRTMEQNMANATLLQGVIDELKLTPAQLGLPEQSAKPYTENDLVGTLGDQISVKLLRGTRLIAIVAENQDPALAQKISQGLVSAYIRDNLEQRLHVSSDANKFLVDEADRLKAKLQKSEQALQAYKEQNQAVSLEETQNIIVEKLKELNLKLTQAKTERLKLESDYTQIEKISDKNPDKLLSIQSVASTPAVLEQKKKVADQENIIANLTQRYKALHPRFIQAQSELQEAKAGLNRTIIQAADSVGTALDAAKDTEQKIDLALKEQEQTALELNKLAIPYNVLFREVQTDRALYDSVLTRLKETDVTKGIEQQDSIRIVEPAPLPDRPIKPKKTLAAAAGLFGGLLAGIGLCFGLNALDSSLKTVDRAEHQLRLPAVSAVPLGQKASSATTIPLLAEPHGAVAEAFRTLRTSLSLLGPQSERQIFLFTSAIPGEGKSFCSSNYAVSLAQKGSRTLLIDADLRLPTIGKIFFSGDAHAGVSDCIAGQSTVTDAIQTTSIENLFVMTAGNRAPNPAELLSGSGFPKMLRELAAQFDYIVLDSAPVNAVSDTLLLVKYVQTTCIVVHAGKTPVKAVLRAKAKLAEAGVTPAGFVLNRLPKTSGTGYYYYYSAGQYGKGVYGAPEDATS